MKILCETQVSNRQTQVNRTPRMVKATLAVGYHQTSKTSNCNGNSKSLEIVHFTPQQKTGVRYKVSNNVEKVFTKYIQDGKATISFIQPPENLMIKCDPIQLKGFLQTLRLGLEGKDSINLRLNIAAATAISQKSQPQVKMTILNRGDYPTKGFPRTLKQLTISSIQLCKITFDICSLRHLNQLNLSYNNIEKIPPELGRLALSQLDLSNNQLMDSSSWKWLQNKTIRSTLRQLDLSANKFTIFPKALIKLEQLITLKMNNNQIKHLPFGVRRMHNLRYLHLSSNRLESLPSAFNHIRLEMLDVWGNNFQSRKEHELESDMNAQLPSLPNGVISSQPQTTTPLWLLACRAISKYKLAFTAENLPWILIDILLEAPKCACGRLCYGGTIYERASLATFDNMKNLVFSRDRLIYVDVVFCGSQCSGKKHMLNA